MISKKQNEKGNVIENLNHKNIFFIKKLNIKCILAAKTQ